MHVVVLGTSPGTRRLDTRRSQPAGLRSIGERGPVLDWLLHALHANQLAGVVTYVGGYHLEKVIADYPELRFRYHDRWAVEGPAGAAMLAIKDDVHTTTMLVREDLVVLPEAIGEMVAAPGPLAVGLTGGRVGIAKLEPEALRLLPATLPEGHGTDLGDLVRRLTGTMEAHRVHLDGSAAAINDHAAIGEVVFRGKGHALEQLASVVRSAKVMDLMRISVNDWREDPPGVLRDVRSQFPHMSVVVRSSAAGEDSITSSGAGAYHTVLGVSTDQAEPLTEAIDAVVASYGRGGRVLSTRDEVLIQPMLTDVRASGVMLTRDLGTGAPYHVLSIDTSGGRADTVTSGTHSDGLRTHYVVHGQAATDIPYVDSLMAVAEELTGLTGVDGLDIEFAFDSAQDAYLLQARPITAIPLLADRSDDDFLEMVDAAVTFVQQRNRPTPVLAGDSTVLGAMPDWNPAEMIGRAPRALALSLYQRLIGRRAWAAARAEMGYRDVQPTQLILSVGGSPFVDVRASINSLLPADTERSFADPLVNLLLQRLRDDSTLHDKIEFELLPTCLAPGRTAEMFSSLTAAGMDAAGVEAYRQGLRQITVDSVTGARAAISQMQRRISDMNARRTALLEAHDPSDPTEHARVADVLIEDCERLGTTSFAVLARHAFIGITMLRGLVDVGALTEDEQAELLRCTPTVASGLTADMHRFAGGEVDRDVMVARYGHLRPGSYDITATRYGADPERYLTGTGRPPASHAPTPDAARDALVARKGPLIEHALADIGITLSADQVIRHAQEAIAAREAAKFEFMKSVDEVLEQLATLADHYGLDRQTASHIAYPQFAELAWDSPTGAVDAQLLRAASFNQKRWDLTRSMRLPDVLGDPGEVRAFTQESWRPNFVTQHKITARLVTNPDNNRESLAGAIVMIESADPGFDWIFGHQIAGLVTRYGGAASHMAIRAAEFDLAAAIGCGDAVYDELTGSTHVELDCAAGILRRIA